jgi:KaiC/GvpD/RAD55 family RecA-like ATPase
VREKTRVKCLAGVAGKSLEWVWDRVVPQGKLTLITGESGAGKSFFVTDVVAAVTRGQPGPSFPVESNEDSAGGAAEDERDSVGWDKSSKSHQNKADKDGGTSKTRPTLPPHNDPQRGSGVLLLSAGDCWDDTVIPRLNAANADMSRVFTLSDDDRFSAGDDANTDTSVEDEWQFQLTRDLRMLEAELRNLKDQGVEVRLVVIDPIDRFLPTAFRKADVTLAVNRLTKIAEKWNTAVIVVANSKPSRVGETGLRSGTLGNPILANAARSVWMVAQDLEIEDRRLLIPLKTNLCKNPNAMTFAVRDGVIDWNPGRVGMTGDDYFTQSKEKLRNPLVREEISEVSRVTNWLREKLEDGPVPSLRIRQDAVDHDIAYSTLRCAFRRLSCVSVKTWFANNWRWIWRMPGNPESRAMYDEASVMTSASVLAEMQAESAD